jgi:hypothetical protein
MAQWEYTHERIELPLGSEGRDVTPEAIREMNRLGLDGWEVCSVLAHQQSWIILLKREIPVMGMGGSGGSGGSVGPT